MFGSYGMPQGPSKVAEKLQYDKISIENHLSQDSLFYLGGADSSHAQRVQQPIPCWIVTVLCNHFLVCLRGHCKKASDLCLIYKSRALLA